MDSLSILLIFQSQRLLSPDTVSLIADLVPALAYFGIVVSLVHQVQHNKTLNSQTIVALLGLSLLLIVAGVPYWLEIVTPWYPLAGALSGIKIIAGIVCLSGFGLFIFPALALSSSQSASTQLAVKNQRLVEELAHCEQDKLRQLTEELEKRVEARTAELIGANELLLEEVKDRTKAQEALQASERLLRQQTQQLEQTLDELRRTQTQMVQAEKMSSLGQLVAGIAHEINNPVNFIHGNLVHAAVYTKDLLNLVQLYQTHYPEGNSEIDAAIEEIDLEFLQFDLPRLLHSMQVGSERICEIVKSLKTFSRLDEAEFKAVDIHEGIDSTLMILHNRLKEKSNVPGIKVIKAYGNLPQVECYPGQLNQVFMNILTNAIDSFASRFTNDALEDHNGQRTAQELQVNPSQIRISTGLFQDWAEIRIADNGSGIPPDIIPKLFDPFFTTKPVGQGTGLGLSISYQIIVEKHKGKLSCCSSVGEGTEFVIAIPIQQQR
jgi:signal transduction histidine kinase